MAWTTSGKAFETAYDSVIVKQADDGAWEVRKANHHLIIAFADKMTATGHAHGIADTVDVQD